jgi:putative transposase
MPSSYVSVRVHCIWSTKNRLKLIPEDAQPRVWAYINQVGVNLGIKMLAVGGVENHVHVLFSLPPRGELAEAVQKLKANSSRFIRQEIEPKFAWQESYAAFSVSVSHVDATIAYIRNQREHHRKRDFEAELAQILEKHGERVPSLRDS